MILCFAEIRHKNLIPAALEILTAGRKAADELKEPLAAVLIGNGVESHAQALIEAGADKVFVLEHASLENFVDEAHAKALMELVNKEKPSLVFLAGTTIGRSLAGRASVLLNTGALADITELKFDAGKLRAVRPCYGGNIMATVACDNHKPVFVTVRPMVFPRAQKTAGRQGEVVKTALDPSSWNVRTKFVNFQPESAKELDVGSADKIVSGGRGLGQADGFKTIRDLAGALGAAVGASRAAVDAGWIPYKHQVGLTGKTVRPKLYVACGISGQVQHLAGMGQADVIVAINKDKECPMMKMATYAIEADLFEFIPLAVQEIQKHKN